MADSLTGVQKTAILFMSLGTDVAAKVMKHLDEAMVEKIGREIAQMGSISQQDRRAVLASFMERVSTELAGLRGGAHIAKEMLEKSMGADRAAKLLRRVGAVRSRAPFDFVKKTDPTQLINFIQGEHPQTIALVLAHLDPNQSAVVLSSLPAERQTEVVRRIATMDKTTPEIVKEVEEVLERKLSTVVHEGLTVSGGVQAVAEVLNRADRQTEKTILEVLETENPQLADEIRRLMFVFEDLVLIDDRGIQQVLKEVDSKELSVALKTASDEVKNKVFGNMSKRAAEAIREEMEFMGPIKLRQVEEAQQRIVAIIRKYEDSGEIVITGRGSREDQLVG